MTLNLGSQKAGADKCLLIQPVAQKERRLPKDPQSRVPSVGCNGRALNFTMNHDGLWNFLKIEVGRTGGAQRKVRAVNYSV